MNIGEIEGMCKKLASKYKKPQELDDLIQIGILKCLELKAEGVEDSSKLWNRTRDAMSSYINVEMRTLSYPKGRGGRKASQEECNTFVDCDSVEINLKEDLSGLFEIKDCVEVLKKELNEREWEVFCVLHDNNNSLTKTAEELGISKQRVSQVLNKIKDRIEILSNPVVSSCSDVPKKAAQAV